MTTDAAVETRSTVLDTLLSPSGEKLNIRLDKFAALDGWDLQRKFVEYAVSKDRDFRREYTLEVLSYATLLKDGHEIPFSTDALIDNHLGSWQNIQTLFEAILLDNGIDPKTHADRPDYWSEAGAQMAIAFLAEATKLFGPIFAQKV